MNETREDAAAEHGGNGKRESFRNAKEDRIARGLTLTIMPSKPQPIPTRPDHGADQPWLGPDEEGDVAPARDPDDTAAWVHVDPRADPKPH